MKLAREPGPAAGEPRKTGSPEASLQQLPGPIRCDPNPGFSRSVLHGVYDLVWCAAAIVGLPWLVWKSLAQPGFVRMVGERLGWGLRALPAPSERPRILVHGVSVGEVKAAQSVVRRLEAQHPDVEVVVSTTTNTGLQVARDVFAGHAVVRFPVDITPLVRRFLRRVRPACVVLVELEIWPNFLRQANLAGIPVAVVNGRITDRSFSQYRHFRWLLPQFNRISLYCVQAAEYAERFTELYVEPERLIVTGNVKADGLEIGPVEPGEELRRLLGGRPGQAVIVAGSTHGPEERHVAAAWRGGAPEARLVLVPRHPTRAAEVERELQAAGAPAQRLTRLRRGLEHPDPSRPVVVDTIGELERVYGLADLVFVGGSLVPHGGQNMLEPAAQGRPVLFGPHVENFPQEALLLKRAGACREVADPAALTRAFRELMADPEARARMSRAGLAAVEAQRGATTLTLEALRRACLGPLQLGGLSRQAIPSILAELNPERTSPDERSGVPRGAPVADTGRKIRIPHTTAMARQLFTSESVSKGHPDKVADQISDAILDACLAQDPNSRVACETMVTTGLCVVAGEITTKANVDWQSTIRETIKGIGYTDDAFGINGDTCAVMVSIDKQSPDISQGVTEGEGLHSEQGAGDQGLMFGFACNETDVLMPAPIEYAHRLIRKQSEVRRAQHPNTLRPDAKSQVTFRYVDGKPAAIDAVVLSTQHSPDIDQKALQELVMEEIIKPVLPAEWISADTKFHINPTGKFVIGGPMGDAGLTGRKIIVDTYGGYARHGGGAFSGKDPSKVDRSAAYAARYVAKNIVAAGLAEKCEIQLSYAIGVAEPTSVMVETFGTGTIDEEALTKLVREHFDLRPYGIVNMMNLVQPIYRNTATYGHFGREDLDLPWERTDKAEALRGAAAA